LDHLSFLKGDFDELAIDSAFDDDAIECRDRPKAIDKLRDRIEFGFRD
jgi:hypothetical protein